MVLLYLGIFVCIEFTPLTSVYFAYFTPVWMWFILSTNMRLPLCTLPTSTYLGVPHLHAFNRYLLRLPHCIRLHVQLRYLCLHTWAIQVYIYVVPVSENFILTMMIKLEVMMSMRRMTVTMTWMVTDCISTMMMKITREMKTKMMYK